MSAAPRVSIIVPFLNVAPFLAEAIESVRAQTYAQWELLLCDDGASDGSTAIARGYAEREPERIVYLAHEGGGNRGASEARNLGLRHARGEIIAFLDGDDVFLPHKLEQQLAIFDAHPDADAMYAMTELWYSWSGRPEDAVRDECPSMGVASNTLLAHGQLITGALRREMLMPCMCSVLVRADVARRVGGFVAEFPGMYDDQVFYTKLSLGASILFVEQCWDRYRRHPGSMYAAAHGTDVARRARMHFLTWLERYLNESGKASDPALRTALRAALRRERHPRTFAVVDGARGLLRGLASLRR